jgi:EpsI family protein
MSRRRSDKGKISKTWKLNRPGIIYALIISSLLMLVFGAGYRLLAASLSADTAIASIDPNTLKKFPLKIGDWSGIDVPIDPEIVRATDTDAHISRNYSRENGFELVWFYVAFGVNARDLMPHRPEVCYSGAGWTPSKSHSADLKIDEGRSLPVTIFEFKRGAWNNEHIIVLDYYIVDGKYCRNVSSLRLKAVRGSGAVGYVAQVQVAAAVSYDNNADSAEKNICSFAAESVPFLSDILINAEKENLSEDSIDISGKNKSD